MQGVGFTDEVSQQDLQEIMTAAATRCARLAPFTLTLGPARVRPEGVNLPVTPEAPVRQLRMAIREAIAEIWGAERVPELAEGVDAACHHGLQQHRRPYGAHHRAD